MSNKPAEKSMKIVSGNLCMTALCSSGRFEWELAESVQRALEKLPPAIRDHFMVIMEDSMHTLSVVLGSSAGLRADRAIEMFGSIIAHLDNLKSQLDGLASESETPPPGYGSPLSN